MVTGILVDDSASNSISSQTSPNTWTDSAGNIFIADSGNHAVRVIAATSGSTPILGISPSQLASPVGNWIAGHIYTIAGTLGVPAGSGDTDSSPILATQAQLQTPTAIALDGEGNLYIADSADCTIHEVSASTGKIAIIAGISQNCDISGDGVATSVKLNGPVGLAVDRSNHLYIADQGNAAIRVFISTPGIATIAGITQVWEARQIYTIAGTLGSSGSTGEDQSATQTAHLQAPSSITLDASGNLYIGDYVAVRVVTNTTGTYTVGGITKAWTAGNIYTVAGSLTTSGNNDQASALGTTLGSDASITALTTPISGVIVDTSGNLYIDDPGNNSIRVVPNSSGRFNLLGTTLGSPWQAGNINSIIPNLSYITNAISLDSSGNLLISDTSSHSIHKVSGSSGTATVIAGGQGSGSTGDQGPATSARLNTPF